MMTVEEMNNIIQAQSNVTVCSIFLHVGTCTLYNLIKISKILRGPGGWKKILNSFFNVQYLLNERSLFIFPSREQEC